MGIYYKQLRTSLEIKYLTTKSKPEIWKAIVQPIINVPESCNVDSIRTKHMTWTAEMNILKSL